MNFTWNETKRKAKLKKHGLDFADAERVFSGHTLTRPDTRFAYTENRFSTIGLLGVDVVVLHTLKPLTRYILFQCEKQNVMNKKTILPASNDLDEAPIRTDDDFKHAVQRDGLKSLSQKKQKINITLDPDVVAWFKQQAGGRGYQTLINAALREAMQKKKIEETIRQVIREELHSS